MINSNIQELKQKVEDGEMDALTVFASLKSFAKELKSVTDSIHSHAIEEAHNYPEQEKEIIHKGFVFQRSVAPGKWDYKNVKEVSDKDSELKKLKKKYQDLYKMSEKGMAAIDKDTGEVIESLPKYTPGKPIVKFMGEKKQEFDTGKKDDDLPF